MHIRLRPIRFSNEQATCTLLNRLTQLFCKVCTVSDVDMDTRLAAFDVHAAPHYKSFI